MLSSALLADSWVPDLLLHTGHADNASDFLKLPEPPALPAVASDAPLLDDISAQANVLSVAAESPSLSREGIREAQAVDNNPQPVIPALPEGEKPPRGGPWDCPEENRVLLGRWVSVVPIGGVPYCHFSSPAGPPHALVLHPHRRCVSDTSRSSHS